MPAPQKAIWKIESEGRDLTANFRPYFISLTLTDARGLTSDDLTINLQDAGAALLLPKAGSEIKLWIGDTQSGLTFKGVFIIDELESSGPPDAISIKCNSTDFTQALNVKRETFYADTTLGEIVKSIAGNHNLNPQISPDFINHPIDQVTQTNESDINLLTRISKDVDATFAIKNNILIFCAVAEGKTASGIALPPYPIDRKDTQSHRFSEKSRENKYTGAKAAWNNFVAAQKTWVTVGQPGKIHALGGVFSDARYAKDAAKAALARLQRGELTMSVTLARGAALIVPETPVPVTGFKPIINGANWIVKSVNHTLGNSAFITEFELETPGANDK